MTPLVRHALEMQPINVSLALHQLNFSTQILALLLVLTDHQTIFPWEIIFAKLVTFLVKPVLEMQRTNVSLALQQNFSTLLLVGMLALMEAQTI